MQLYIALLDVGFVLARYKNKHILNNISIPASEAEVKRSCGKVIAKTTHHEAVRNKRDKKNFERQWLDTVSRFLMITFGFLFVFDAINIKSFTKIREGAVTSNLVNICYS